MFDIEDKGRKNFENGMGSEAWGLGKKLQNRPDATVGPAPTYEVSSEVSVEFTPQIARLRHNCITAKLQNNLNPSHI
jgi:hypothetical protein